MSIMGISKSSLYLSFLVLCSLAFVAFSQGGGYLPCMQKLLPCQPYLKGTLPPPAMCCVPMKEIVEKESKCLCAVFNNAAILKSLNITQDDGLNLAKTCGANADTSLCQTASASPPGIPATPTSPSTSNSSVVTSPPKKNAASISQVGRFLSVAAVISSVIVSVY